jgi:hypothetical protein
MPLPYQLFRQPGNNPFGAAIQAGRNSLGQRRHLSDSHRMSIPYLTWPPRPMGNGGNASEFEEIREISEPL